MIGYPKPPKREQKAKQPLPRSTKPKPVNAKRKKAEHLRAYGSPERIAFVKSLPCVACGVVGYSEVAHVGNGGAGRKADANMTVPLCATRSAFVDNDGKPVPEFGVWEGCHPKSHRIGILTFSNQYALDLTELAAETERAWQAFTTQGK